MARSIDKNKYNQQLKIIKNDQSKKMRLQTKRL